VTMIGVLLADDQPLMRAGLRALIDAQADMAVVAEASTGREAVELARRHRPQVVLMDVRMPDGDGLQATRDLLRDASLAGTRVVMLTTFELEEYVLDALRAGASGFLLKGIEPADLVQAVRTVAAGDALLAPSVTRRLLERFATVPDPAGAAQRLAELTPREHEVLTLVGSGLTNAEIAEELVVSPLTAKTHVSRVMIKLGARDRVQLAIEAYETGLVVPGNPHERNGRR
jgi:DNA-binding NarL/FixJ family response regulator